MNPGRRPGVRHSTARRPGPRTSTRRRGNPIPVPPGSTWNGRRPGWEINPAYNGPPGKPGQYLEGRVYAGIVQGSPTLNRDLRFTLFISTGIIAPPGPRTTPEPQGNKSYLQNPLYNHLTGAKQAQKPLAQDRNRDSRLPRKHEKQQPARKTHAHGDNP